MKKETPKLLSQPYLFALQEGKNIKNDLMDYSLMMMQITKPEIIKAPSITGVVTILSSKHIEHLKNISNQH